MTTGATLTAIGCVILRTEAIIPTDPMLRAKCEANPMSPVMVYEIKLG